MNADKFKIFRSLHDDGGMFVMPNPWDIGSTRIFSQCGFKALATTSGGMAYALGQRDGFVGREQVLQHCCDIASATDLPVSADLENGYGDSPEEVAQIIRDVAATGVAGCSIEDYTGDPANPIFDETLAVERIQAAVEAKNSLDHDFVLTARCESYVWTKGEFDPVVRRLQAFERAGADIVFTPGMQDLSDIKTLVQAMTIPVNVIVSSPNLGYEISDLQEIGVRRISIGSVMAQLIYGTVIDTITNFAETGNLDFTARAMDYEKLEAWFTDGS